MKTKELPPKSVLQPSAHDSSFTRTAGSSSAPPALQFKSDDSNIRTSSGETLQLQEEDEILMTKADESIQRMSEDDDDIIG